MDAPAVSEVLTRIAVCGALLLAFAAVAVAVWEVVREEWRRGGKVARRVFLVAAAGAATYGGAKSGRPTVSYPPTEAGQAYLVDRGSYVTNDFVHIDFTRRIVPDDAALVIERREVASTNAADWAVYLETTFAAFAVPTNLPCANATNWNWAIWADWTPPPSVQTNGVLHAEWGRTTRDAALRAAGLAVGVPVRSSLVLDGAQLVVPSRRLNYDAEVEWLQGDGKAYIDTGWIPSLRVSVDVALARPTDYTQRNQPLFGTRAFVSNQNHSRGVFCEAAKIRLDWLYSGKSVYHSFSEPSDHFYSVRIWADGSATRATVDEAEYSGTLDLSREMTAPFLVFWMSNAGSNKPTTAKIAYLKASDETRAFDFIPVRKGRVGYLYDRVGGRLYGNAAGTGAFLVGPDKPSSLSPETAARAASDALDALTGAVIAIDPIATPEERKTAK